MLDINSMSTLLSTFTSLLLTPNLELNVLEDGRLSREELINGYKNILNQGQEEVAEEEVNRIMS